MKRWLPILCAAVMLFTGGCAPAAGTGDAGEESGPVEPEYAKTFFDTSYVHTIDIRTEDGVWETFIQNAEDEEYISIDMVIDGESFENAAIRGKGNSSKMRARSSGKYSFKVEFDHFTDGLFRGLDKLSLNNLCSDNACMRDYIVFLMMAKFGVAAPLCSFVFITVNGEDWGFYLAVEGLEDAFLERNFGSEHGNLYKPDNLKAGGGGGGGGFGRGEDVKLKYVDDNPDSYYNIFASAKTDITRKDQYRLINALKELSEGNFEASVDIERQLRYLVPHVFVFNGDSYTGSSVHNYYLYEDRGLLSMLPWDYNEAFGTFGASGLGSVVNWPIDSPLSSSTPEDRPMVGWVFSNDAYIARYHEMYQEFLDEICYSGWAEQVLRETSELIAPYVQRDPRSFTTYESFLTAVDDHITYFRLRAASVQGQLNGTIPSTSAGQSAEPDAKIDTSELSSGRGGFGSSRGNGNNEASGEARRSRRSEQSDASSEAGETPENRSASRERTERTASQEEGSARSAGNASQERPDGNTASSEDGRAR